MYKFSVYIKQLNDMPGKTSQKYRANVGFTWKDDGKICSRNTEPTRLDSPAKTMQLRFSRKHRPNVGFTCKNVVIKVFQKHRPDVGFTCKNDVIKVQIQKGSNERLFILTRIHTANFRGNPFHQATKRHLNNR